MFFLCSHTYELSVKWASIMSSPEDLVEEALLGLAGSFGPVPADDGPVLAGDGFTPLPKGLSVGEREGE